MRVNGIRLLVMHEATFKCLSDIGRIITHSKDFPAVPFYVTRLLFLLSESGTSGQRSASSRTWWTPAFSTESTGSCSPPSRPATTRCSTRRSRKTEGAASSSSSARGGGDGLPTPALTSTSTFTARWSRRAHTRELARPPAMRRFSFFLFFFGGKWWTLWWSTMLVTWTLIRSLN